MDRELRYLIEDLIAGSDGLCRELARGISCIYGRLDNGQRHRATDVKDQAEGLRGKLRDLDLLLQRRGDLRECRDFPITTAHGR